jgi:AraC family transcriptional regulator of arabinose operon
MLSIRCWFPDSVEKARPLGVRGIGIREEMPPCTVRRPDGTGDYLFMVFHDDVTIGSEGTSMHPPGTIVLWEPGDAHFYGNEHRRWRHSWIHCSGPAVKRLLTDRTLPMRRPMVLADPSRCDKHLFDLYEELNSHESPDWSIARNVLENLLRDVGRQISGADQRVAIPPEFLSLRTFLESNYPARLTLAKLADRVGLSVPHFCARFKQLFGVPPIAYLLHLRLEMAAWLVRHTTLSVT